MGALGFLENLKKVIQGLCRRYIIWGSIEFVGILKGCRGKVGVIYRLGCQG